MGDISHSAPVPEPAEMPAFTAWRLFLGSHAVLVTRLDAALRARADLPLTSYDVLSHVSEAPHQRIRLRDLETRVFFSQSTMSRVASRLEDSGYLERSVPSDDRRTVEIKLTAAGAQKFRTARSVAIEVIREDFVAGLAPGDADRLLEIFGRLRGRLGPDGARDEGGGRAGAPELGTPAHPSGDAR